MEIICLVPFPYKFVVIISWLMSVDSYAVGNYVTILIFTPIIQLLIYRNIAPISLIAMTQNRRYFLASYRMPPLRHYKNDPEISVRVEAVNCRNDRAWSPLQCNIPRTEV